MPNSNGRIYIDTSTTPNKGIDVRRDVAHVLGRSTRHFGQLCGDVDKNGIRVYAINKWSKYKPVILGILKTTAQMNPTTKRWLPTADWWKGTSGRCGFETIQSFSEFGDPFSASQNSFAYKLYNLQLPWDYTPPYNTPFRVPDFLQYNHNAIAPFAELQETEIPVQSGTITIPFDLPSLESDNLALSDLIIREVNPNKTLADWYLGGLFVNGSNYIVALSSNRLGDTDLQIVISDTDTVNLLKGKTWNFVPFFAENTSDPLQAGNHFISMGATERKRVNILEPGYNLIVYINAMWNQAGTQISWEIEVVHSTSGTISCGYGAVGIHDGNPDEEETQQIETSGDIYIGNVGAYSSVRKSGTIACTKTSNPYYVKFNFNDTQLTYTSHAMQIEDYESIEPIE